MAQFFGVHQTAAGVHAAQYGGSPVWLLREGTRQELKARLSPGAQAVLADAAGRSLGDKQKLLDSWRSAGIPVARVLDPHTALAIDFACAKRFRMEGLVAVVECDGIRTQVTLTELSGDMIEELAFFRFREGDSVKSLRKALTEAERRLEELAAVLILDSENHTGQIRYTLRPGAQVRYCTGADVTMGAAIYGAVLAGSLSDLMVLRCLPYALGVKTELESYTRMLPAGNTYPCFQREEFATTGQSTLDFTLVEEQNDRVTLGTYRISGIPEDTETVVLELNMGSDGNLTIYASPAGAPKKHLPLAAVTEPPKPPVPDAPKAEDTGMAVIKALLPVYDNLYLAVSQPCTDAAYKRGIGQILKNITKQLSDLGAEPYGDVGDEFDPKLHNAVIHLPDFTRGENEISRVFRRGFRKDGTVLRFADVQVAN